MEIVSCAPSLFLRWFLLGALNMFPRKLDASRGKHGSAFTLPELLVIIVIMSVIASIGVPAFFFLVRRARANSVALEIAGWLENVRNSAADIVSEDEQQGGCEITFNGGTIAIGLKIAGTDPDCVVPEQSLLVPQGIQDGNNVNISLLGPDIVNFTPRGLWVDENGIPGEDFELQLLVNNQPPLRCVRLTDVLGAVEIGRAPTSLDIDGCTIWDRL